MEESLNNNYWQNECDSVPRRKRKRNRKRNRNTSNTNRALISGPTRTFADLRAEWSGQVTEPSFEHPHPRWTSTIRRREKIIKTRETMVHQFHERRRNDRDMQFSQARGITVNYYDDEDISSWLSFRTNSWICPNNFQPERDTDFYREGWVTEASSLPTNPETFCIQGVQITEKQRDANNSISHFRRHFRATEDEPREPMDSAAGSIFTVRICNLHCIVTEADIEELFEVVGPVVGVVLKQPGFAEVSYRRREEALCAIKLYHNTTLDGQPMEVTMGFDYSHGTGIEDDLFSTLCETNPMPLEEVVHAALFGICADSHFFTVVLPKWID